MGVKRITVSLLCLFSRLGGPAAQHHLRPRLQALGGLGQCLPRAGTHGPQQQEFHAPAGISAASVQAGRDHARIVRHQQVTRPQVFPQPGEHRMRNFLRLPPVYQQPCCIPWLHRLLGNQLRRQVIVKVFKTEGGVSSARAHLLLTHSWLRGRLFRFTCCLTG